ncbi:MAG: hypothetical protein IJS20_01045 [Bacteroidales bacterium]|nr:hypothetical protein [Bacteroidales bacterium]
MTRLTLCRILGTVFILSGVAKAFNIGSFAYEVRLYADAYFWDGLAYWATPIAVLVCTAEIFFGLLALRQDYSRVCSVVFFVLLTFFSWLTAVNYFAPSLFGSIESCGCFGELIHFSPLASFVKSAVMWIVATYCLFESLQRGDTWFIKTNSSEKRVIAIASCTSFLLPLFSLYTIEIMEHIIYSILYFAICIASVILLVAKGRCRCETK